MPKPLWKIIGCIKPHDWRERLKGHFAGYRQAHLPPFDGPALDTIDRIVESRGTMEGIWDLLEEEEVDSIEKLEGGGFQLVHWIIEQCAIAYHGPRINDALDEWKKLRDAATSSEEREAAAAAVTRLLEEKAVLEEKARSPRRGPGEEAGKTYLMVQLEHGLRARLKSRKDKRSYNSAIAQLVRATFGGELMSPEAVERSVNRPRDAAR